MGREHRAKLSVTVDPDLYQTVAQYAARARVSKSRVVEEAIRLWERNRLALLAKEGYQKMAAEDVQDAEAYLPVLSDLGEA
ncbi:MAG: ribbon-helix-helix protein, CopG family [Acidobacteria bacterium]|nr:ribbon-helix-helix protein, CopG family [Acidobacteriota bacterium]